MGTSIRLIIATLAIIGAIAYLVLTSASKTGMQYLSVSELARLDHAPQSDGFRLDGTIAPGSVVYDQRTPRLSFQMTDGTERIAVIYDGLMPDAFADGREVVVEGVYRHEDRALHATKLVTKCPSKYEAKGLGADKS
jgi:cytochrome c-type biogenesis protein CcmE